MLGDASLRVTQRLHLVDILLKPVPPDGGISVHDASNGVKVDVKTFFRGQICRQGKLQPDVQT